MMPAVITTTRTVYQAPTKRRAYLSLRAAANAEANAQLDRKYPAEKPGFDENGFCYDGGYHWSSDERLIRVQKRLARRIRGASKKREKP